MKHYIVITIAISILMTCCSPLYYNNTIEYTEEFPHSLTFTLDTATICLAAFSNAISNIDTCGFRYDGEMHPLSYNISHVLNEAWWYYRWKEQYDVEKDSIMLLDSTIATFHSFLEKNENSSSMFYIGRLNLSNDFDSYLIASSVLPELQPTEDDFPLQVYNYIYLVNVKDERFLSMIKLWSAEFCAFAPQFTYTTISNGTIFRQREVGDFCMSDVIEVFSIWSPETWFLDNPTRGVKFIINSNGKVEIL